MRSRVLFAAVHLKRLTLNKSAGTRPEIDGYLDQRFRLGSTLVSTDRRKRARVDDSIVQQVETPSHEVAQSLVKDVVRLHDAKLDLEVQLRQDRKQVVEGLKEVALLKKELKEAHSKCTCPKARKRLYKRETEEEGRVDFWKRKYRERGEKMKKEHARQMRVLKRGHKEQVKAAKGNQTVEQLLSRISSLKSYNTSARSKLRIKHKKKEKELLDRISFLENKVLELEEKIAAQKLDHTKIATVIGGRYIPNFRLVVYEALQRQCPVEHVGNLIRVVIETMTGKRITNSPCASTAARIGCEMSILADLQTAEILLQCENCTISWDATELSGAHVNEIHIAAMVGGIRTYHTLSIAQLPGGTTEDYVKHVKVG